ncbi:MAG: iron-containing alcohol dehydrogenase [Chloroflexi bacterium]|nr:iron-containing alcohol dehydrogenase [Actinomycetota bacterium]MCL5109225.1 iron-containing alcohol dehydrogenase [Chloroflexota bacterium]
MEPTVSFGASKKTEFRLPPVVQFGPAALAHLGAAAAQFGKRALLVTDPNIRRAGHVARALASLDEAGVTVAVYDGVVHEPSDAFVAAGLRVFRDNECELAIAVGGGSPIDTAKAVALMATNEGPITSYMGADKVPNEPVPIIAVPTTAGTGSEMTRNAIITDTANDVKMLIASPRIIPRVAIVDPQLTLTMPPDVAAATGIDALTHAIEAYVSKRAQPVTDALAVEAIRLLGKYLRRAWANADDLEAKYHTAYAASLAGMAFSNSSVALVHGMARPIGALFHATHSVSNAILLPTVMEFSLVGAPERFASIAQALGEPVDGLPVMLAARRGVESVRELCADVRIPGVVELGYDRERFFAQMPKMAADALASGSPNNNPRVPTKEEIIALYAQLWG